MYVLFEFIKPNIHSLIIHTKVFQSIPGRQYVNFSIVSSCMTNSLPSYKCILFYFDNVNNFAEF